jgi:hypothetical protein
MQGGPDCFASLAMTLLHGKPDCFGAFGGAFRATGVTGDSLARTRAELAMTLVLNG